GGGIPVVRKPDGTYEGVEAVIDKDLAASLVGRDLGVDTLAIVTDVPGAAIAFGKRGERWLAQVSDENWPAFSNEESSGRVRWDPRSRPGSNFWREAVDVSSSLIFPRSRERFGAKREPEW